MTAFAVLLLLTGVVSGAQPHALASYGYSADKNPASKTPAAAPLRWDTEKLCPALDDVAHSLVLKGGLLNGAGGKAGRGYGAAHAVGAVIEYGCAPGFFLHGAAVLTCETSGTWSSAPPLCTRVRGAPAPTCAAPAPAEGLLSIQFNVGGVTTRRFLCKPGFRLAGPSEATCTERGWTAVPRCAAPRPSTTTTLAPAPAPAPSSRCPAGKFEKLLIRSNVVSNACRSCPQGKYGPGDGACHRCGAGESAGRGAAACVCKPGYFGNPSGQARCYSMGMRLRWTNCNNGVTAPRFATPCRACPTGKFSGSANALECLECAVGQFSWAKRAALRCKYCAPGRYGAPSKSGHPGCARCPAGQHQVESGAKQCEHCAANTFQPLRGKVACKACAKGEYQSRLGASTCYKPRRCSHVRCTARRLVVHGFVHSRIKTFHHKLEQFGIKHACSVNSKGGCVCSCW